MGRHKLYDVQFEETHPGCTWGILHILHYHQWHNVKKMLPHRKHSGRRHARCKTSPKTNLNNHDIKMQEFADAEAEYLPVEQKNAKTSPTNSSKISGKAQMKTTISKEISKEDHKYWNSSSTARTWLRRLLPIHHLEHSDNSLSEIHTEGTTPIVVVQKCADTSATCLQYSSLPETCDRCGPCGVKNNVDAHYLGNKQSPGKYALLPEKCDKGLEALENQNVVESNQLNRDVSNNQSEYLDVLGGFNVKKESFQERNLGRKHFQSLQNSSTKARLTKSRSFPLAYSSRTKSIRPMTLKQKQNESWFFPKGEKFLAASLASDLGTSKPEKEDHLTMTPFTADNNGVSNTVKEEKNFSSSGSPWRLSHQGWNQQVINRFKDIKQKIRHALKENRKESSHSSMEAILERDPSGKEMSERSEFPMSQDGIDNPGSYHGANGSGYDLSWRREASRRRTFSLVESLDRYTELFERSFGGEAKWNKSKSLKLTNEGKVSSSCATKSYARRLSLPDLDSLCSFLNDASGDALSSEMPLRTVVDCTAMTGSYHQSEPKTLRTPVEEETPEPIHAALETQFQKDTLEGSDRSWNIQSSADLAVGGNFEAIATTGESRELAVGKSSLHQDQIMGSSMNHSREIADPCTEVAAPDPVSNLETCFPEDLNSLAELPIYEGLGSNLIQMDEPDASVHQQNRSSTETIQELCSIVTPENKETASTSINNHNLHSKLDKLNDAYFNYVGVVLELSGFIKNEYLGTWYSLDQPLSPSLFKELEACLHPELEDYEEEVDGSCDHQLLFDLINDTLVDIYERSFTYFPKAFSFNRHIRPMPKGHQLLEEVWTKINSYLSLRPELDQSLEDVVARDLVKCDGWMNLQFDSECVALELEDVILEELLDELVCACAC